MQVAGASATWWSEVEIAYWDAWERPPVPQIMLECNLTLPESCALKDGQESKKIRYLIWYNLFTPMGSSRPAFWEEAAVKPERDFPAA